MRFVPKLAAFAVCFALVQSCFADDGARIVRIDHYVRVRSEVPAMKNQPAEIYVREVAEPGAVLRGQTPADRVVLFIHGAGTPGEVAFDVPKQDYSWMEFLAHAGFDVFAMDMTGYGRSTRPAPMNDPCNLTEKQQAEFIPRLLASPCPASYPHPMTTIASDWNDIGAVVDHIRELRHVDRVSLVAWSLGGPRSGGYTAQHPGKISRLVLLAPAYSRTSRAEPPPEPAGGAAMNTQSRDEFIANWDRQVGCPGQYENAVRDTIWSEMLASDSVGATWGTGVRRAPRVITWGWNAAVVAKMQTPVLMISGAYDKEVAPARVRDLYADMGAKQKVFADLACSSHNAMWEKNHLLLFQASLDWLTKGSVNGMQEGTVRLGYSESERNLPTPPARPSAK